MTSSDFASRLRNYPDAPYGPALAARLAPKEIDRVKERKARFDALNRFATERGGWITSIPGDRTVIIESVTATIASDLADLGYSPVEIEGGTRILPTAIEESFVRNVDGTLSPLTEGNAKPVAEVRTHAGIVRTRRYCFTIVETSKQAALAFRCADSLLGHPFELLVKVRVSIDGHHFEHGHATHKVHHDGDEQALACCLNLDRTALDA
jgi:hypothetical protein